MVFPEACHGRLHLSAEQRGSAGAVRRGRGLTEPEGGP
jgi:hypothetical protein